MADYYGHGGRTNTSESVPGSSLQHADSAKIFVGGLSWQTTEESLRWHFEQYGQVVSVEVMRDRVTGDPRGFAFVVFSDSATVDLVMKDKDKHEINHKLVDVKRAQARGIAPPSIHGEKIVSKPQTPTVRFEEQSPEQMHCKVFVGGLPPHVDRDELKQIFEQFGTVIDSIVMLDQATQRSRCFGFVTFGNNDQIDGAAAAQASIDAQPLDIQGRHVEVKLATPRAETQAPNKRLPPAPKHLGLRAGQVASTGEFAGLAVAYGRSGWKAGYGTKAFGKSGWNIWEDTGGPVPERAGFSFDMLSKKEEGPPKKRLRH